MPASPDHALRFDDLFPSFGDERYHFPGVDIRRDSRGDWQLDPQYLDQLSSAFVRMPAQPSLRERIVRDGTFAAGAAPFGFAGPNFDRQSSGADPGLSRFRVPPPPGKPVDVSGVIRSLANGIATPEPIYRLNAATNAAVAPLLNDLFDPENQLSEPTWSERYEHSLRDQYARDKQFAEDSPILDKLATAGGKLLRARLMGKAKSGILNSLRGKDAW